MNSSESDSYSRSESDFSQDKSSRKKQKNNKRKAKMLSKQKNPKPDDLIRCKFCLGKSLKLKSLLPHIRAFHQEFYKSDLSSFFYIAEKG